MERDEIIECLKGIMERWEDNIRLLEELGKMNFGVELECLIKSETFEECLEEIHEIVNDNDTF